jgi:hypothetical protein
MTFTIQADLDENSAEPYLKGLYFIKTPPRENNILSDLLRLSEKHLDLVEKKAELPSL